MSVELPDIASNIIKDLGYSRLYPTQEEAIKAGVLDGASMLITTPTASGKTLIALLASIMYLARHKRVIYMTPLKALANEKYEEFKILERYGANVMISTSDLASTSTHLASADVIILTNEKLDSLMRHDVEWLSETGLFIADEIHTIASKRRGSTLEIILSKILTYHNDAQLLALSATVSNAEEIASWLRCKLIKSDWRPVRLKEGVYNQGEIIFKDERVKITQSDRGASIDLAIDCIKDNGQALIFTETRRKAVSLALKASEVVNRMLSEEEKIKLRNIANAILEDDTEQASSLAYAISNGVSFHHAGLSHRCRMIVEHYYREGLIRLITTTPTLAAGVNLPARRVIINSIRRFDLENGMEEISVMEYKQMCGRAGRPRYDDYGEAIIVSNEPEYIFDAYINAKPEPIRSNLLEEESMKMHLLGIIASLPAIDKMELLDLFKNTLMARYYRLNTIKNRLDRVIEYLIVNALIIERDGRYLTSDIGKLAANFYLHPETAILFNSLIKSKGLEELKLLHIITEAYDFSPKISLRSKDYDILEPIDEEYNRSLLALYAWINEHSERFILERYGIEPGDLYRMVESAEWLLQAFTEFARKEPSVMRLASILRERVRYGIKEELLELVSIKDIGRVRARALYNAGIRSIYDIRNSSLERLASIPKIGGILAKKIKTELER